jgi:hypothetical protein
VDICRSLSQLPNGTSEGCRAALLYARNRLPSIRREHFLSEELDAPVSDTDATPPMVRGEHIDERLRDLIASVTTALDAYNRLSAEEPTDEVAEVGIMSSDEIRGSAVERSLDLETGLDNAAKLLAETSNPKSQAADELKRQISDGQGLNRLARTELRMPEVLVGWYRRLLDALKNYPALIRRGASELKIGADIFEIGFDRWHEFKTNSIHFLLDEFRTTCDAFGAAADKLDERKRRKSAGPTTPEDEFDFEVARAMILVGRVPPADWIPSISHLHFGTRRLRNLTHLASLTHLRSLTHVAARVHDLTPLAGLTSLETVDLWGTKVTNLGP